MNLGVMDRSGRKNQVDLTLWNTNEILIISKPQKPEDHFHPHTSLWYLPLSAS